MICTSRVDRRLCCPTPCYRHFCDVMVLTVCVCVCVCYNSSKFVCMKLSCLHNHVNSYLITVISLFFGKWCECGNVVEVSVEW